MIRGTTAVYGIFGHPVEHSLSPAMQNACFRELGLDAIYVPFHVLPQDLPAAVNGLRAMAIQGVNVTLPHKEALIPLLDEVDPRARAIGAVNTIAHREGRLIGHNTDWVGVLSAMRQDLNFDPAGKRIVMLGAGGASRAGVVGLAEQGAAHIAIANRTLEKARELAEELAGRYPATEFQATSLAVAELAPLFATADAVINSISAGLKPGSCIPLPWAEVSASSCFFDMLYSPGVTPMVQQAREAGVRACDGMGMLSGQGEESFRLWTGQAPPAGLMRRVLESLRVPDNS